MTEKCQNTECKEESHYTTFIKIQLTRKGVYDIEVKVCAKHALELSDKSGIIGTKADYDY